LWHGIDVRFALYGLCLGAGTSVNKLYQYTLLRRLGRSRTNLLTRHPLYTPLARALALSFFIIALGFLWIVDQPTKPSSLAMWAEGAIFVFIAMLLFSFLQPAHAKFVAALRLGKATRVAFHCVQVVVVLAYLLLLDSPVPPLLYEFF
jgi:D-alanyl-lipoteichoic acid acyltransferase DltB (MBOAT superfamily)